MKTKFALGLSAGIASVFVFTSINFASAIYSSGWYRFEDFTGEYPNGFSVVDDDVVLMGRATMETRAPKTQVCPIPKNAVYHPWNKDRAATYVTMSKIIPLKVIKDGSLEVGAVKVGDEEVVLNLKKDDIVEYLVYGSEGGFIGRYKGKEHYFFQDFFDFVDEASLNIIEESNDANFLHEWIQIPCTNNNKVWILFSDLSIGNDGIDEWERGAYHEDTEHGDPVLKVGDIDESRTLVESEAADENDE